MKSMKLERNKIKNMFCELKHLGKKIIKDLKCLLVKKKQQMRNRTSMFDGKDRCHHKVYSN